jgi:hypothetical protein
MENGSQVVSAKLYNTNSNTNTNKNLNLSNSHRLN